MVVLSARKTEIEEAAEESGAEIIDVINTLVNGKKAGVYKMRFI
jgi:hypothetical protein